LARIRTIKPEFWEDETIGTLSREARLLFLATLNLADDEGLLRWNAEFLKASAFIYDPDISVDMVSGYMRELVSAELLFPYVAGRVKQELAWIVTFRRHQKINRPQPAKLPPPSIQNLEVKFAYAKRDRWICHLCNKIIPHPTTHSNRVLMLSLDHLTPQVRGGSDHPSNLLSAHSGCNSSRRDRPIEQFTEPFSLSVLNDSLNDSVTEGKGKGNGIGMEIEKELSNPLPPGGALGNRFDAWKVELPEWLPRQTWTDFVDFRRSMKSGITKLSCVRLMSELTKLRGQGCDPVAVVDQSISNNWKGFFPIKSGGKADATREYAERYHRERAILDKANANRSI